VILSDAAILDALRDGRLRIDPPPAAPAPGGNPGAFDPTSVNLRLGQLLRIPAAGVSITFDPAAGRVGPTLERLYDPYEIPPEGFVLDPGRFILGMTMERIALPLPSELPAGVAERGCLAGRVEGKSSLARMGLLIHFTAPTIHAGFEGTIALEMMNLGPAGIRLRAGMPICQLILEPVVGTPMSAGGQFLGQADPAGRG